MIPTGIRQVLHVDMDAFYAAVEQRDNPRLRGRPVIVGGPSRRGVVCTASYEARPYGVRSAMSMRRALALCPHATVIAPRMQHYSAESRRLMSIFRQLSPEVEPLSLDEAFIDVTFSGQLFGSGRTIAETIRERVRRDLNLTCSVGVATNKFIAKVASELHKPDGLTVVAPGTEAAFLAPLPVGRMWGVGPKMQDKLVSLGFCRIGDLAGIQPEELARRIGSSWGSVMAQLARGHDERAVVSARAPRSIGAEVTFETDIFDRQRVAEKLLHQAARVAQRLTRDGYVARVIVLKIKYGDFRSITRSTTVPEPIGDTASLYRVVTTALLSVPDVERGIRLSGISAQGLVRKSERQLGLFGDTAPRRRERLEELVAHASARWGSRVLRVAGSAEEDDVRVG